MGTYSDYLESGRTDVALLVEHESAVLHAASREEADVTVARELLRRGAGGVVGRGDAVGWTDYVEMVGD
jgi:hypothetical protein